MKLQTEIPLNPEENQVDYSSKILLLGSCFSENIGARFEFLKFQNLQNPFGIIYNPVSIEKLVVRALENTLFTEDDIFESNGIWKCFEVHSQLSAMEKNQLEKRLNVALSDLREALLSSTHIIITFGTAWVYRKMETNKVVANCHKLPQLQFKKELLSIDIISRSIENIVERISNVNPEVAIIFTVSPVRHLKDGYIENSVSKAHLQSSIYNFINTHSTIADASYFPSYEIMMDELRDYRFYSEDLIHINKTAIEIIWEKFSYVWISSETKSLQKEIVSIQRALLHKPFNPESVEHGRFLQELQQRIELLKNRIPHILFD